MLEIARCLVLAGVLDDPAERPAHPCAEGKLDMMRHARDPDEIQSTTADNVVGNVDVA